MPRLPDPEYLAFPLCITSNKEPRTCGRVEHVRQQIEQLLFTEPHERCHRPDFGGGLMALVFEANHQALRDTHARRLSTLLAEVLQGEVDPRSIEVSIDSADGGSTLIIHVRYRLATLGRQEQHAFAIRAAGEAHD